VGHDFEIRPVREHELAAVLAVTGMAFGEEYSEEDVAAYRVGFPFARSLAAFDEGKLVAVSAVLDLHLTVPGGADVPMGGVTWIATLPTHRRRGLMTRLMAAGFSDMAARGEPLAGLGASEGTIYGRFGFGPATSVLSFSVERAHAAFAPGPRATSAGRFILLDAAEAAARLPAIYESLRSHQVGSVSRPPALWAAHLADPPIERGGATRLFHVVHETAVGVADGYVTYRVNERFDGATARNTVRVVELMAADPAAYRELWKFAIDTDLSHMVSCERGRVDEPLRWLLADSRHFHVGDLYDFLWLRLLDIPKALTSRRYATGGRLVIEVSETYPTPSTQRYVLQVESAGTPAECETTSSLPDLVLDIGTLASTYLGGVSFANLAAAGRVRELKAGAITQADTMFSTGTAPFCATEF
jgi:predicted acetyltransferase